MSRGSLIILVIEVGFSDKYIFYKQYKQYKFCANWVNSMTSLIILAVGSTAFTSCFASGRKRTQKI